MPCPHDRQQCIGPHRQSDMPIPPFPRAHFVVIQPDLLFGQFNGFFHPALGSLTPVRPAPSWGLSTVGTKSRNKEEIATRFL